MTLYIVTSQASKKVIASKSYIEISEFIKGNQDARIRTIDYTGKTKILNKKAFLNRYLKATGNKPTFFALTEIMIPKYTNYAYYLNNLDLMKEYNEYKKNM